MSCSGATTGAGEPTLVMTSSTRWRSRHCSSSCSVSRRMIRLGQNGAGAGCPSSALRSQARADAAQPVVQFGHAAAVGGGEGADHALPAGGQHQVDTADAEHRCGDQWQAQPAGHPFLGFKPAASAAGPWHGRPAWPMPRALRAAAGSGKARLSFNSSNSSSSVAHSRGGGSAVTATLSASNTGARSAASACRALPRLLRRRAALGMAVHSNWRSVSPRAAGFKRPSSWACTSASTAMAVCPRLLAQQTQGQQQRAHRPQGGGRVQQRSQVGGVLPLGFPPIQVVADGARAFGPEGVQAGGQQRGAPGHRGFVGAAKTPPPVAFAAPAARWVALHGPQRRGQVRRLGRGGDAQVVVEISLPIGGELAAVHLPCVAGRDCGVGALIAVQAQQQWVVLARVADARGGGKQRARTAGVERVTQGVAQGPREGLVGQAAGRGTGGFVGRRRQPQQGQHLFAQRLARALRLLRGHTGHQRRRCDEAALVRRR
jgi:hypothetical protein